MLLCRLQVQDLCLSCWHALLSSQLYDTAMQQTDTAVQAASAGLVLILLLCTSQFPVKCRCHAAN